jgi:hypothetical protein
VDHCIQPQKITSVLKSCPQPVIPNSYTSPCTPQLSFHCSPIATDIQVTKTPSFPPNIPSSLPTLSLPLPKPHVLLWDHGLETSTLSYLLPLTYKHLFQSPRSFRSAQPCYYPKCMPWTSAQPDTPQICGISGPCRHLMVSHPGVPSTKPWQSANLPSNSTIFSPHLPNTLPSSVHSMTLKVEESVHSEKTCD